MVLNSDAEPPVPGVRIGRGDVGIVQYIVFNGNRPGIGEIDLNPVPRRIFDVITENPEIVDGGIGNTCSVGGSNLNTYKIIDDGGI